MQAGETILGKFKIVDLLGQGGMGSVWRVDHLYLGRQFALKCLNKQHANDVSWRRFQNEAKAASKLDHPNLIKVHEFDLLPDGRPFILMDLVKGETLTDVTKSIGSMPVQRAVDLNDSGCICSSICTRSRNHPPRFKTDKYHGDTTGK